MKLNKTKQTNDYITLGIIIVLHFVIFTASSIIGMTAIGNIFVYPACSLLWGILFVLLAKKAKNKIVIFLYPFILALIQFMNFWLTGVIGIFGALATYLLYKTLDSEKFSTLTIAYTAMIVFMYLGATIPVIYFKDVFFEIMPAYAELYSKVYDILIGYMFYVGLFSSIICAIIGSFIGKKALHKHFEKSGIIL